MSWEHCLFSLRQKHYDNTFYNTISSYHLYRMSYYDINSLWWCSMLELDAWRCFISLFLMTTCSMDLGIIRCQLEWPILNHLSIFLLRLQEKAQGYWILQPSFNVCLKTSSDFLKRMMRLCWLSLTIKDDWAQIFYTAIKILKNWLILP